MSVDALARHRMLLLAGVAVPTMYVPPRVEERAEPDVDDLDPEDVEDEEDLEGELDDETDDLEDEESDEDDLDEDEPEDDPEDEDVEDSDEEAEPEPDDEPESTAMLRHRQLQMLGIELRARSNPAPGRQVVTREGAKKYGLPMGATILPGMRALTAAQQAAVQALGDDDRGRYLAARREGATHAAAMKAAGGSAPVKAAKATAPAKKAAPRKAAGTPATGADVLDHVTKTYGRNVPVTKKTSDDLGRGWRKHSEYQDAFARKADELASLDPSDPKALREAAKEWREAAERERGVSRMRASQKPGTFHHARGTAGMAAADQYENVADYLDRLAAAPPPAPAKATPTKKAAPAKAATPRIGPMGEPNALDRRMARQYGQGKSLAEIAEAESVSASTVHKSLVQQGMQLRPRGGARTPAKKAAAPAESATARRERLGQAIESMPDDTTGQGYYEALQDVPDGDLPAVARYLGAKFPAGLTDPDARRRELAHQLQPDGTVDRPATPTKAAAKKAAAPAKAAKAAAKKAPAKKVATTPRTVDPNDPLANLDAREIARVAYLVNIDIPGPAKSAAARRTWLTEAMTDHQRRASGVDRDSAALMARRRLAKAAQKVLDGQAPLTDADLRREAKKATTTVAPPAAPTGLDAMSVDDLIALARSRGISIPDGASREDILRLLRGDASEFDRLLAQGKSEVDFVYELDNKGRSARQLRELAESAGLTVPPTARTQAELTLFLAQNRDHPGLREAIAAIPTPARADFAPGFMEASDLAGAIIRLPDEAAISARLADLGLRVGQLRQVARQLSIGLPDNPPGGRWTAQSMRDYIARITVRDRGRFTWRSADAGAEARHRTLQILGIETRADLNPKPGDNNLRNYWVYGKGRAKWNTFTELRRHLLEHVGPERADRIAAQWFHLRFGFWPGADLNRVRQGKPPRGKLVGPG